MNPRYSTYMVTHVDEQTMDDPQTVEVPFNAIISRWEELAYIGRCVVAMSLMERDAPTIIVAESPESV